LNNFMRLGVLLSQTTRWGLHNICDIYSLLYIPGTVYRETHM